MATTFRSSSSAVFLSSFPNLPSTSKTPSKTSSSCSFSRRAFSTLSATSSLFLLASSSPSTYASGIADFVELERSGGVKALDLRQGDGEFPVNGDQVAIHYYGRLAAKQGWRFDSTYDHKDEMGESVPFAFVLGSGKVISGIEAAVTSMKVGGIRRVIIPPSQGYQNTSQEPLPPNFFDRQRLFTTIFNPTRLANGEGSTLGTLIFDIELDSPATSVVNGHENEPMSTFQAPLLTDVHGFYNKTTGPEMLDGNWRKNLK